MVDNCSDELSLRGPNIFQTTGQRVVRGQDGADGNGYEYIYAVTADPSIPENQRPSNDWGFDEPDIINGLTWHDNIVDLSQSTPYLWRCQRSVLGEPEVGTEIEDEWSMPTIFGRFGSDGTDGIAGANGQDGNGYEYVFAAENTGIINVNQRPSNNWGFDEPQTVNGIRWWDAAPGISESNRFLWRSERRVEGIPAIGTAVTDDWTVPVVVGRVGDSGTKGADGIDGSDGEDGVPGEDGIGREYIFTVTTTPTIPVNQRPSNTWGYDEPDTVNGLRWSDSAPGLSALMPYLWRSERQVVGSVSTGDNVTDNWSEPVIVGRWGADGIRGQKGERGEGGGIDGEDGEDGLGVEYCFTVTTAPTIPANKKPLDTWGYDEATSVNGQAWSDGASDVTEDTPYLWRSQRTIVGSPSVSDPVPANWTDPVIVGRYGERGIQGEQGIAGSPGADGTDGQPGEDGVSYEFIFAVTNVATIPANQLPSNNWGYDEPTTIGQLRWHDAAPNVTADTPNLFVSQRIISGTPNVGDPVSDTWTTPKIIATYGQKGSQGNQGNPGPQGIAGQAGNDGAGYEYIFAVFDSDVMNSIYYPQNHFGYDEGGTITLVLGGGVTTTFTWYDAAPNVTADNPFLFRSERKIIGTPSHGSTIADNWTTPIVVGRYGVDGEKGNQGTAGIPGTAGEDGESALGYEYIFTISNTESLGTSKYPNNTWGFDSPGTSDNQVWQDHAPTLTSAQPILFRSERKVVGTPSQGDPVPDTWLTPVIIGRYGIDGVKGVPGADGTDGQKGADGFGIEYIFLSVSYDSLEAGDLPLNGWGYDNPGRSTSGLSWSDGANTLSEDNPILWRSERKVPGDVAYNDQVSDNWSTPVIVGRWGSVGEDGAPGVDGIGREYCYAVRTGDTQPTTSQRPSNNWGYDSFPTGGINRSGFVWHDDAPALTSSNKVLFKSERRLIGQPSVGDPVPGLWSIPVISARYGSDGARGPRGIAGSDGEDAHGVEYIFARGASAPPNPDNNWGFDSPVSPWFDYAPNLNTSNPILYRSQRNIEGTPNVGSPVTDTWDTPRIVGRYGADGAKGEPGDVADITNGSIRTEMIALSATAAVGSDTSSGGDVTNTTITLCTVRLEGGAGYRYLATAIGTGRVGGSGRVRYSILRDGVSIGSASSGSTGDGAVAVSGDHTTTETFELQATGLGHPRDDTARVTSALLTVFVAKR